MIRSNGKIQLALVLMLALSLVLSACGGGNNGNNGNNGNGENMAGNEAAPANDNSSDNAAAEPAGEDKPDTSREVKLKMILIGDKPADADEVYAELGKLAKRDINAAIEIENFTWGEYKQKYPLLFSTGEDFDLIYASNWAGYLSYAGKNAFLELSDELLAKYAPNTWKETPAGAWEQAKVNGKVYMVPQPVQEYTGSAFIVRGDLREKYGVAPIKDAAGFEAYLDAVAKNEKSIVPFAIQPNTGGLPSFFQDRTVDLGGYISGNPAIGYGIWTKDSFKAENVYELEANKQYLAMMKKWYDNGYISKNALMQKETSSQLFEAGKSAAAFWSLDRISSLAVTAGTANPSWKPEVVVFDNPPKFAPSSYIQNGVAVNAGSKNPERALMLLDLLKWNKEYSDLTWYGIKGKHWEPVGDDKFKSLPASGGYPPGSNCPWGWRGPNERWNEAQPQNVVDLLKGYRMEQHENPYAVNFTYNDANVKNENAAINNLVQQYMAPASIGIVDFDTAYAKFKPAADKAGLAKVLEDLQKQIDAYKAANP